MVVLVLGRMDKCDDFLSFVRWRWKLSSQQSFSDGVCGRVNVLCGQRHGGNDRYDLYAASLFILVCVWDLDCNHLGLHSQEGLPRR